MDPANLHEGFRVSQVLVVFARSSLLPGATKSARYTEPYKIGWAHFITCGQPLGSSRRSRARSVFFLPICSFGPKWALAEVTHDLRIDSSKFEWADLSH